MESPEHILKKVGRVLLIVGVVDIAVMAYCITNQVSYSSSFNIFALIAGILLMRGSIRTARVVTFFGAFMLSGFLGALIIFPFMGPFDLKLIAFILTPIKSIFSLIIMFSVLGLLYWVYKNLVSEPVMVARKEAGLSHGAPKLAFSLGAILVLVLSISMYFLNNGSSSEIAKSKALKQFGGSYRYHVTSMSFSGGHVYASLSAYREGEIKEVSVDWRE